MNRILSKCRDFGLIVRLCNMNLEESVNCVKSLKKSNLPLCIIDLNIIEDWEIKLQQISESEDLFIAVQGIDSIESAYSAISLGAQFFILDVIDITLMENLQNCGFYFIPKITNENELLKIKDFNIECIIASESRYLENNSYYNVFENNYDFNIEKDSANILSIIDIPSNCANIEIWANNLVKKFLGFNYTEITVQTDSETPDIEFANIFSSINKCMLNNSTENIITLECNDIIRAIKYFKWREIYIDPVNIEMINGEIKSGYLDTKIANFTIKLKEKNLYEY